MTKPSALELARQLISEQNRRAALARWRWKPPGKAKRKNVPGIDEATELARKILSEQSRNAANARWKRLNKAQRREATAPGVEAAARKKREQK